MSIVLIRSRVVGVQKRFTALMLLNPLQLALLLDTTCFDRFYDCFELADSTARGTARDLCLELHQSRTAIIRLRVPLNHLNRAQSEDNRLMLDTTPPPLSDLIYLSRLYAATSPSTPVLIPSPPFPSPIVICTPFVQNWLVESLLRSSSSSESRIPTNEITQNEEEGNKIWKKIFWRRVVSSIESGFTLRAAESGAARLEIVEDEEIRSEILEEMIRCMSVQVASGPGTSSRRYEWGALEGTREEWKSITVREEGKVISDGMY